MKRKIIVSSILTIALCLSMIAGSTFALFTSNSEVNVAVNSATVKVVATAGAVTYGSTLGSTLGSVNATGSDITLTNILPGDYVDFNINVVNESTVTVNYRTVVTISGDKELTDALVVSFGGKTAADASSDWSALAVGEGNATVAVHISLPETTGNECQNKSCTITYVVEAVQGNYVPATPVSTVEDLKAALESGKDVAFKNDIASNSGNIKISGETVLDGNGQAMNVTVKGSTDAAITVTGGTIKNLDIAHANHSTMGVGIGIDPYSSDRLTEDLTLENVSVFYSDDIFDRNIMYALYAETGSNNVDVVIKDSALYGAVDVVGAKTFTATNTTFGSGAYWFMALSGDSTFTDCTFEDYCILAYASAAGSTFTFNNCNVEGTQLTAENFKSLLVNTAWDYSSDMCSTNLKNCTIIIDGVAVVW